MLTPWEIRVLEVVRNIPAGRLMTYKQLAEALGNAHSARAVGNALRKNPFSFVENIPKKEQIPCHRVVRSDGRIGCFAGSKEGMKDKRRLLEEEGIQVQGEKVCDMGKYLISNIHGHGEA